MAVSVLSSQGTKIYVAPKGTDVSDCTKVATALGTAKLIGCPQSLGNIEESRDMTEYKCLSSDDTAKTLGAITRGSLEIGLLLDVDDTDGQKALKDAFAANEEVIILVELPDSAGAHGTTYVFTGLVSSVSTGIEQDAAITYDVTVEIASAITECPAA